MHTNVYLYNKLKYKTVILTQPDRHSRSGVQIAVNCLNHECCGTDVVKLFFVHEMR